MLPMRPLNEGVMTSSQLTAKSEVRAMLEDLCARNANAEVQYGPRDSVNTARVRMLAIADNEVCTDLPQIVGSEVSLRAGDAVSIYLLHEGTRYAFDSRVSSLRRRIALNERQKLTGMALTLPNAIRTEQRRRDYRVGMRAHSVRCTVMLESEKHAGACDLKARWAVGDMFNLSARGAGIVFPFGTRKLLSTGSMAFVTFTLPENGGTHVILAEMRHAHTVRDRETEIIGMRFTIHEALGGTRTRTQLGRFVVEEQRRMLRRKR